MVPHAADPDPALVALGWDEGLAADFAAADDGALVPARALEVQRGFVLVGGAAGEWLAPVPAALRKSPEPWSQAGPPATGDWLVVEPAGAVRGILPRRTVLRRFDETAGNEILVANADLAVVVTSLNRDLNVGRIERLFAIAHEGGIPGLLALSKSDLSTDPAIEARKLAAELGVETVFFSSRTGGGLEPLRARLRPRRTTVLIGSSGVGKSTLVNTLLGEELQRTLEIRAGDDRGRHATTSRTLLRLPDGALVVDTPGLRSPRPSGAGGLETTFEDVFALARNCRFADCTHQSEPGCAVRAAVEAGELPARRVEALRKLEAEVIQAEERSTPEGRSKRRARERAANAEFYRDLRER